MNDQAPEAVLKKTIELCQTILNDPEFAALRKHVEAFEGDDKIQQQYQDLSERGSALQQKQRSGTALSDAEIADFEKRREAFLGNPVARGFLDAQQSMHDMRETVNRYVSRTFELGRVPGPDDFHSCGHGCSCG